MRKIIPACLLALLLWACSIQEPESTAPLAGPVNPSHIIPGYATVLVDEEFADRFPDEILTSVEGSLRIRSVERVFPDAGEFEARHRAAGLHRWYRVSYDEGISATKAQADLSGLPGVEAVSFPRRKVRRGVFNDPGLAFQWNLINTGKNPETGEASDRFLYGMDINIQPVWENYTAGSSEVIVAVIDSGIDSSNPDLGGVMVPAGDNGSRSFINYDGDVPVGGDDPTWIVPGNHGSHVAGIIGAINNNRYGISGIAGGRNGQGGVRLMSCAIFEDRGEEEDPLQGSEDLALIWAADHGAVIANNSWGFEYDNVRLAEAGAREFLNTPSPTKAAIDYFIDYAGTDANGNQTGPMKGGVVFFAAGNEGWEHDVPGEYDRIIAVGAVGPDGRMAEYSNYGPWVDILAPGGSDADIDHYEEWILSAGANDEDDEPTFYYMPGTSMACPHVAGVAALLVSYYGGAGFTNEDLKERLLGGIRTDFTLPEGRTVGGGMLDALGAFDYSTDPDGADLSGIRVTTSYKGDYRIKSHETLEVDFNVIGNREGLTVRFQSDCPGASATCTKNRVNVRIKALDAEPGEYTGSLRVGGVTLHQFHFTILENHAPVLSVPFENQIVNAASVAPLNIELNEHFQDPDGETLSYSASLSNSQMASATLSGSHLTLSPSDYGQTDVTVTASDARGQKCTTRFSLLARNAYQEVDVYPNPATDFLRVRPAEDTEMHVTLYSRSGAVVFSESASAGPFNPILIELDGLAPGTYTLKVEYGGKQQVKNIVKL